MIWDPWKSFPTACWRNWWMVGGTWWSGIPASSRGSPTSTDSASRRRSTRSRARPDVLALGDDAPEQLDEGVGVGVERERGARFPHAVPAFPHGVTVGQ